VIDDAETYRRFPPAEGRYRYLIALLVVCMAALTLVTLPMAAFGAPIIAEFQVSDSTAIDYTADIDGYIVVWRTDESYSSEIMGYDIVAERAFAITDNLAEDTLPRISGDWVIWLSEDKYHRHSVILRNIRTDEQRIIPMGAFGADISGDYAAFSNSDIWVYHIPSETLTQVTDDDIDQGEVSVAVPWVVWREINPDNGLTSLSTIRGYNIYTHETMTLTLGEGNIDECCPAVSDGVLVWQGNSLLGGSNILAKELPSGEVFTITDKGGYGDTWVHDGTPQIDGNTVVWRRYIEDDPPISSIYAYNLQTGALITVTGQKTGDALPRVSGEIAVWQRYDNAPRDFNIYGAWLKGRRVYMPVVYRHTQ
jgi:hypothetical protein